MSMSLPKSMMYGTKPVAPPTSVRTMELQPTSGSQSYQANGRIIFQLPGSNRNMFVKPGSARLAFKVTHNFQNSSSVGVNPKWDCCIGSAAAISNYDLYVGSGNLVSSIQNYSDWVQFSGDALLDKDLKRAGYLEAGSNDDVTGNRRLGATVATGSYWEQPLFDPVFSQHNPLAFPLACNGVKMEFTLASDAQAFTESTIASGSASYSEVTLRFDVIVLENEVATMVASATAGQYMLPIDYIRTHRQVRPSVSDTTQQTLLPIRASSVKRVWAGFHDTGVLNDITQYGTTQRFNPLGNAVQSGGDTQIRVGTQFIPATSHKNWTHFVTATKKAVGKKDGSMFDNKIDLLVHSTGTLGTWLHVESLSQLDDSGNFEDGVSSVASDIVYQTKYGSSLPSSVTEQFVIQADGLVTIFDHGDATLLI